MFLECGHGGVCHECATAVFSKVKRECPLCRQRIDQVVRLGDQSYEKGGKVVVDVV